jgi:radical SAM modification target selenobiotic family peptide
MEIRELKKILSKFGIAGLIAGAGLTLGAGTSDAGSS